MKRRYAAVGCAVLVGLAGCGDTTAPPQGVEARIAHLAPGAGPFSVGLDDQVLLQSIAPLQFTYLAVRAEPHLYLFENASLELSVDVPLADITAILLMNAPQPELRAYQLQRRAGEENLVVVNADTSAAPLTVLLETADDTASVTLDRGEGTEVALDAVAYTVRVHLGDVAQAVTLQGFTLQSNDHGFVVIYPSTAMGERYARFLF